MNNHDRCIGAVYINASNEVVEFFQSGDSVIYGARIYDLPVTDIDLVWTDVTLTIPSFATRAEVTLYGYSVGGTSSYTLWRPNGSTSEGHYMVYVSADSIIGSNTFMVITDSNQKIEILNNASNGNTVRLDTNGWYLPIGM